MAGARGVDNGISLIGNPAIEGPLHLTLLALLALGGLTLSWIALGLNEVERGWIGGLFRRGAERPVKPPRRTVEQPNERSLRQVG